jgi:two-component system, NtrC family, sensor kinase
VRAGDAVRSILNPIRPAVVAVTAALVVLGLAATGAVIWQARNAALLEGHEKAIRLVQLLNEQTSRAFQTADLVLRNLKERLEDGSPMRENDPGFQQRLKDQLAELPYIRALFVIGADGYITHDSDYPTTPRVSLADRDYFVAHQEDKNLGVHVAKPLISRSVNRWFVPISRRIEQAEGKFNGIVVAAVEPRFFESFYRELGLGPRDSVALFNSNTILIARHPQTAGTGRAFPHLSLFKRVNDAPVGTYHSDNLVGDPSIISYRAVPAFPLIVTVSLDQRDVLAKWRNDAIAWGVGAVAMAVLLVLLAAARERRRNAEAEARSTMANLAHMNRVATAGELSASMAHELKQPLAAIVTNANVATRWLNNPTPDFDEVRAALNRIVREGHRASHVIGSIRAMFKKDVEARTRVDVNEIIREVLALLQNDFAKKRVTVQPVLTTELPHVLADRIQLQQVILNLVVNAVEAMESVTDRQRILQVRSEFEASDGVLVTVRDSGPGIDPKVGSQIFDPFFTTKAHGMGMGLSICRSIVESHGGRLTASDCNPHGSMFQIVFPIDDRTSVAP